MLFRLHLVYLHLCVLLKSNQTVQEEKLPEVLKSNILCCFSIKNLIREESEERKERFHIRLEK